MHQVGADEWSSVKVEVATNWPDISWAAVVDPCSVVDEAKGKSRTRRAWRMVDERQRRGVGYAAKGWADAETDGGALQSDAAPRITKLDGARGHFTYQVDNKHSSIIS